MHLGAIMRLASVLRQTQGAVRASWGLGYRFYLSGGYKPMVLLAILMSG
jgi:hypothetical protein